MNKQKIKANAKKTAQYSLVAPAVGVGTVLYSTALGVWHITKSTGFALKCVANSSIANTREYINEVKDTQVRNDW